MNRLGLALCAFLALLGLGIVILDETVVGGEVFSSAAGLAHVGPFPPDILNAPDQTAGLGDQFRAFEPWLRYAADHLAEDGRIPLWKTTSFCGAPLVGNGQSSLFFPPNLLALAIGAPWWYQAALGLSKLVLGAFFAYLLARHLGISFAGSLVAGVTFGFFGFEVAFLTFPLTNVSFLLPLLVLVADRALLLPSGRRVAALALVCALQHLGGHPETSFHSQSFTYLVVLVHSLARRKTPDWRFWRRQTIVTAGFVLGAVAGALQILPTLEYIAVSDTLARRELVDAARPFFWKPGLSIVFVACVAAAAYCAHKLALVERRLTLWAVLLFVASVLGIAVGLEARFSSKFVASIAADWLGGPRDARAKGSYLPAALPYMGPAIALAFVGMLFGQARGLVRTVGILFWSTMLLGLRAPLLSQTLDLLPVFSAALNDRLLLITNLCAAVLAGVGIDALGTATRDPFARRRYFLAATVFIAAIGCGVAAGVLRRTIGESSATRDEGDTTSMQAGLESARATRRGTLELEGWFLLKEPPVACQVVTAVRTEPVQPTVSGTESRAQGYTRYRFEVELEGRLPSPRASIRIEARDERGRRFRSRALAPPVDWRTVLSMPPVVPQRGSASMQLWLYVVLAGGSVFLLRGSRRTLVCGKVALVGIVFASTYYFADGFSPSLPRHQHYPPSRTFDELLSVRPDGRVLVIHPTRLHETIGYYGIPHLLGYDGLAPVWTTKLLRLALDNAKQKTLVQRLPVQVPPDSRLAGLMAARYVAWAPFRESVGKKMLEDPALELIEYAGSDEPWAYAIAENANFLARARLVPSAVVVESDEEACRRLADPELPLDRVVVLASGEELRNAATDAGRARIEMELPDRLRIAIEPKSRCYLVLSDTFFAGWNAYVDGEERPIHRANVAFRAVAIEPGDSVVEFRYEPSSLKLGALLALAALSILVALCFLPSARLIARSRSDPAFT